MDKMKKKKKEIEVGDIYGEWTVLEKTDERTSDRNVLWLCRCSCGTERKVNGSSLRQGKSKSCGHNRQSAMTEGRRRQARQISESIVGEKFGRLLVLTVSDKKDSHNHTLVECQCDCGTIVLTTKAKLQSGHTQSCGCLKSKGEEQVAKILTDLQIPFSKEVRFPNCRDKKPMPFDFGVLRDKKIIGLIEYHGDIHYSVGHGGYFTEEKLQAIKRHDRMKMQYCNDNKIPLIVIPYTVEDIKQFLTTSSFWKQIFPNS